MSNTDLVEELVERWEDARAGGHEPLAEELCRDHPHLAARVAREIDLLRRMDWMDRFVEATRGGDGPPDPDLTGEVLDGRYRLETRVGRGAFGVVWKAADTARDDRPVAVKIPCRGEPGEGWVEYTRVAGLKHPNVVPALAVGKYGPGYYIVSEFVDGTSLADLLRAGPVGVSEAVLVACRIVAALRYIHGTGTIHCDLKPGNILLDTDGRVYVTDFGIALWAPPGRPVALSTPLGTLAYMAPEQCRPGAPIDARCDLYAFGVILFEMLTGGRPYGGAVTSKIGAWFGGEPPPAPSELDATLPPYLDAVARNCLAPDPRDRYVSADELLQALNRPGEPGWRAPPASIPVAPLPPSDPPAGATEAGRPVRAVAGLVRWARPVWQAVLAVFPGLVALGLLVAAATEFQRTSPNDPRLIALVVIAVCVVAGAVLVGRWRAGPVLGVIAAGAVLGFWLTGINLKLWGGLLPSLVPGSTR